MAYQVNISPSALKQLGALPQDAQTRIGAAIDDLKQTPRPDGVKKLKGKYAGHYRLRVGSYRVVYFVNDKVLYISVVWIGQRGGAYK